MIIKSSLSVLSDPIPLGNTLIRNRFVMGPMAVTSADPDGRPNEQTIAFLRRRAAGGVGMIIVGGIAATSRSIEEAPFKPLLRLDVDDLIPDFRRVADAVHEFGVPLIAEIMPGFGRMGVPAPGRPIISASPINVVIPEENFPDGIFVPGGRSTPLPDAATIEEIQLYELEMVKAAVRAFKSNWDGVEVAAHMSYFAASFLSPRTNWREDDYGGSLENRARMLVNIVRGIREKLGSDFIVGLRITANDYVQDSIGAEGFAEIARLVEKAGADYVALTTGCYETMYKSASSTDGELISSGDAKKFKSKLTVPVILQGLHDPSAGAEAIDQGHGDLIMLARPLLADPDYPKKVLSGKTSEIIKCDRKNLCIRRLAFNMPARCSANELVGRESRKGRRKTFKEILVMPFEASILWLTGNRRVMKALGAALLLRRK